MTNKKIKNKFTKPTDVGSSDVKCKKCGFVNHFGGELYNRMADDILKCTKCGKSI